MVKLAIDSGVVKNAVPKDGRTALDVSSDLLKQDVLGSIESWSSLGPRILVDNIQRMMDIRDYLSSQGVLSR